MGEQAPAVRKLPGFALNLLGINRAYDAGDHLLVVTSVTAFETYRRYYYREIKALVVRPTGTSTTWNIMLTLLLAVIGAGVAALLYSRDAGETLAPAIVLGSFGLLLALMLLWNVLRGKTCRVYVQTRAGTELLAAPARLPAVYRLHAIVAPKIAAAQAGESARPPASEPPPAPAPAGEGAAA